MKTNTVTKKVQINDLELSEWLALQSQIDKIFYEITDKIIELHHIKCEDLLNPNSKPTPKSHIKKLQNEIPILFNDINKYLKEFGGKV